jgi:7,8-dihydropterin-6-yl-methyl-4-(beta-D-ribofuranosyl)aminobenzene 5'-phosphate synthase
MMGANHEHGAAPGGEASANHVMRGASTEAATAPSGQAGAAAGAAPVPLLEVDAVEITTLYENLVDAGVPGGGPVRRLRPSGPGRVASRLFADDRATPFVGGHGLSLLVRATRDGVSRAVLFDAGGSPDGLVHNLDCLELRPSDWSCIVLSHGHWDHTLGLIGLQARLGALRFPLVLHPDAYLTRAVMGDSGKLEPLMTLSRQGLRDAGLDLTESERPSLVVEGMMLVTGQVPRLNDFETGWPAHHAYRDGVLTPDPLVCDDQGLVLHVRGRGLVVVSGCGHAGIVNLVEHARALTGVDRVHAVLGGFHLGPPFFHDRIGPVVDALVAYEPAVIAPAHCTGYRAAYAVYRARPDAFVQNTVGTRVTIGAA